MIRRIVVDQFLCENENVSVSSAIVFDVIVKLMSHSQIQKVVFDDGIYTVIYRNMILLQLKYFKISTRTLSDALRELEDAGLIESINKNTTPAYRTTQKADEYNFLPKNGEFSVAQNNPQKNKKEQLFSLHFNTTLEKITDEYKNLLKKKCFEYSTKQGIDFKATFEHFWDYHSAKGSKFKNWFSAYKNWCRTSKRFNQPKNHQYFDGVGQ